METKENLPRNGMRYRVVMPGWAWNVIRRQCYRGMEGTQCEDIETGSEWKWDGQVPQEWNVSVIQFEFRRVLWNGTLHGTPSNFVAITQIASTVFGRWVL